MPTELLPNQALATLVNGITTQPPAGTVETWTVNIAAATATNAAWPTVGNGQQCRIQVQGDTEIMLLTAGVTTAGQQTWTVTRGVNGTTTTQKSASSAIISIFEGGTWANAIQLSPGAAQSGDAWLTGRIFAMLRDRGGLVYDVTHPTYGADNTGNTDSTAAVQAAINAAYNNGGGTIFFPHGVYLILGQLVIPNTSTNAGVSGKTGFIRLTGQGGIPGSGLQTAMTRLILRYESASAVDATTYAVPDAKIISFGSGWLEIDHLVLSDDQTNHKTPFLFLTNCVGYIHQNAFWGPYGNNAQVNNGEKVTPWIGQAPLIDGILLGSPASNANSNANGTNDYTSVFNGYGTVIDNNIWVGVRRLAVYGAIANAIVTSRQFVSQGCGNTSTPWGPAIDFVNANGMGGTLNQVRDNSFEITSYNSTIRAGPNSQLNFFGQNAFWDGGPTIQLQRTIVGPSTITSAAAAAATTFLSGGPVRASDSVRIGWGTANDETVKIGTSTPRTNVQGYIAGQSVTLYLPGGVPAGTNVGDYIMANEPGSNPNEVFKITAIGTNQVTVDHPAVYAHGSSGSTIEMDFGPFTNVIAASGTLAHAHNVGENVGIVTVELGTYLPLYSECPWWYALQGGSASDIFKVTAITPTVTTTLNGTPANAGQAIINVSSATGLSVGQSLRLGNDGAYGTKQEAAVIQSIVGTQITLTRNLFYSYTGTERVQGGPFFMTIQTYNNTALKRQYAYYVSVFCNPTGYVAENSGLNTFQVQQPGGAMGVFDSAGQAPGNTTANINTILSSATQDYSQFAGLLIAPDGVSTRMVNGQPYDTLWLADTNNNMGQRVQPVDGLIVGDYARSGLWLRVNGTWVQQPTLANVAQTFQGPVTFGQDIGLNGHVYSNAGSYGTPTVTNVAGTSPPVVTMTGNTDRRGTISITLGTGTIANPLAQINFGTAYGVTPHVTLTPQNAAAAAAGLYVSSRATGSFQVAANVLPSASATLIFSYSVEA